MSQLKPLLEMIRGHALQIEGTAKDTASFGAAREIQKLVDEIQTRTPSPALKAAREALEYVRSEIKAIRSEIEKPSFDGFIINHGLIMHKSSAVDRKAEAALTLIKQEGE